MVHTFKAFRIVVLWVLLASSMSLLASCATTEVAPPNHAETLPEAITIPYRISSAGRFMIDIAVNGHPARPFAIDTGATLSVIYEKDLEALNLTADSETVLVRGLVTVGIRPVIDQVEFEIGMQTILKDRVAVLETPTINDGAIGLLGTDVLATYAVVFNKENMMATFVPSEYVTPRSFIGWRQIPVRDRVESYPDKGLHFAQIFLEDKKVPVLIDTGSNLNFVNWPLATLDPDMQRLQRTIRKNREVQGALDTSPLRIRTRFHDLILGRHYWPEIDVVVMELDTLSTVAPVDKSFMIAGAGLFTPWTVAFDLGGNQLYIRANPEDPRPPSRNTIIRQSQFVPQTNPGQ